jgi:hypothetical protein
MGTDNDKYYQIGTIWYKAGLRPAKRGESGMSDSPGAAITMVQKIARKTHLRCIWIFPEKIHLR